MKCTKCGAEFSSENNFCPNCGHKLVKEAKQIENVKEVLPIQILFSNILKYKYWVLGGAIIVIVFFIALHFYNEKQERDKTAQEMADYAMSVANISGTYSDGSSTTLYLNVYNNLSFIHNGRNYKGYWKELRNGAIELNFSESVKYSGPHPDYYDYDYHSTLYLYDGIIWPTMSALRSYDTQKAIYVTKKK